jgi:hypothetical protein
MASITLVCAYSSLVASEYSYNVNTQGFLNDTFSWTPELSALQESDVLKMSNNSDPIDVSLSSDWETPVNSWEIGSFIFNLGKGKTLSSPDGSFYITGGCSFYLTSGMLYSPNKEFTVGRWTPNIAYAEFSGEDTVLKAKGILFNGKNSWNGKCGLTMCSGAKADLLGGKIDIVEGPGKLHFSECTITNFTGFNVSSRNNLYFPWGNEFLFSNCVVVATGELFARLQGDESFSNNVIKVMGGSYVEAPKIYMNGGLNNCFSISGEGTEVFHSYQSWNGFSRFYGVSNKVEIADSAVFRTIGERLYASISIGYSSEYHPHSRYNSLSVSNGGRLIAENADIIVSEISPTTDKVESFNKLSVTGEGSLAVAGESLHVGGSYNNQALNHYQYVVSNTVEVSNGGVFSNLCMTSSSKCYLPVQGYGNNVVVDGGFFYSSGSVDVGREGCASTNNTVEIRGGGIFQIDNAKPFRLLGCSNSLHIVDGKMSVPLSSVNATTSGSYARIEIGTNGCIQANALAMDSPTSELIINLPENGIQSPVIKANMSINAGVKVIFNGLMKCASGTYLIAETPLGGYIRMGAGNSSWESLNDANARLEEMRPGSKLRVEGESWTSGKSVKLYLTVSQYGTILLVK